MNSRSLGATAVYAWPDAEIAVMGPEAAVDILYRKVLAAAPRTSGIDPAQTRRKLADAFAAAPAQRGQHGNIPL
jgi:acetyl-CoA/propionyl-CoA carboxylase carboxyl transferase subunit